MRDQFRHQNITPEIMERATRVANAIGLDPEFILSTPERFNEVPLELRSQFFDRVDLPAKSVALNPFERVLQERIDAAPKGKTFDANTILTKRIEGIETAKKEAVTKETTLQQAAIPQLDEAGRVVRDQPKARETRKVKDFMTTVKEGLVGGGETLLTGGTTLLAAPPAATAQLMSDILTKLGGKKPQDQGVYRRSLERFTYAPRTETAKDILEVAAKATEALPPVLTPEFMALAQARPGQILSSRAVPGYVAQTGGDVAAATRAIPGDIRAAAVPALEGIGMRSVGAAGRADKTRFEAAVNMLPEEYRAIARAKGYKNVNPAIIEAHAEAMNLPVPFQGASGLTAGQASGDIVRLSREYNQRGKNPDYAYRFQEQNRVLVENLDRFRDIAAPEVFDSRPLATGQTLTNAYRQLDERLNDNINAKHQALRDAAGGDFPVDVNKLAANVEAALKKEVLRSKATEMSDYADIVDLAKSGTIDFDTYLNLRRNLGDTARTSNDGKTRRAAGVMVEELEKLPLRDDAAHLKGLADDARLAARERFDMLNPKKNSYDPAFKAVVNKQIADDRFVDSYLFGARGTKNQLEKMIQNLGEDQKQVVAAAMIERLKSRAVAANGDFNPAVYIKEFNALEPRLLDVFSGETVQQMRSLGNVAKRVKSSPSGSFFNRSGTLVGALAETATSAAEQGINLTVMSKTGIPIPIATLGRERLSARKSRKEIEETLEPLAGAKIKLQDIGKE